MKKTISSSLSPLSSRDFSPLLSKSQWGSDWLQKLHQERAIAVIQAPTVDAGLAMAGLAVSAGMQLLEVTLTSDRPFFLVEQMRQRWPHCWVGVGTVLSLQQLESAIAAGAQFGFSPIADPRVIEMAFRHNIPYMAGALTPNEIWRAWQAGATAVKVFPASALGGPSYLKNLRGPLGQIPLVPTGGLTIENASEFIEAGAIAVCVGGALFPRALIAQQDWTAIAQRASRLMESLRPFRRPLRERAADAGEEDQDGKTRELDCSAEPGGFKEGLERRL